MLFDLRGRGRQRTVKVIYLFLAVLMGGGLVLFGIGGNTSGGLVDAITGNGGGATTGSKTYRKDVRKAEAAIRTDRTNDQAWLDLIRARAALARSTKGYNDAQQSYDAAGKAQLLKATQAWESYQATKPKDVNVVGQAANIAIRAYAGVNDEQGVVDTAEVVAESKNTAQAYAQLADYAYRLGQTRKGELAGQKAIALADPAERAQVRASIQASKAAAPTATPEAAPSATPSATATAKPKG
jgi:hypothetical protein